MRWGTILRQAIFDELADSSAVHQGQLSRRARVVIGALGIVAFGLGVVGASIILRRAP